MYVMLTYAVTGFVNVFLYDYNPAMIYCLSYSHILEFKETPVSIVAVR